MAVGHCYVGYAVNRRIAINAGLRERKGIDLDYGEKQLLENINYNLGLNYREIGDNALEWKLSSAQNGHGIEQLRDNNLTTFWQLSH